MERALAFELEFRFVVILFKISGKYQNYLAYKITKMTFKTDFYLRTFSRI